MADRTIKPDLGPDLYLIGGDDEDAKWNWIHTFMPDHKRYVLYEGINDQNVYTHCIVGQTHIDEGYDVLLLADKFTEEILKTVHRETVKGKTWVHWFTELTETPFGLDNTVLLLTKTTVSVHINE